MTTTTLREKFQAAVKHINTAAKFVAKVAGKVAVTLATDFARAALMPKAALVMATATAGLNLMAADTRRGLSTQNHKDLKTVKASGEKGAAYAKKYESKAGGHAAPARKASFAPA